MKKIYLIRHAQSESNAGIAIRPNPQINITEHGQKQALALADWLNEHLQNKPIQQVFVSPYIRTQQTAKPYLHQTARTATVLDLLHEINIFEFEQIQSLSFPNISQLAKEFWLQPSCHKSGKTADSFDDFYQRVQKGLKYFSQLQAGEYVAFTHGMWIGMLIWQLLHCHQRTFNDKQRFHLYEPNIRPNNCDVYLLTIDGDHHSICKLRHNLEEDASLQTM